jgi:hypothetical protein
MAMSRLRGGMSLTSSPSMRSSPLVIISRPAIIRRAVVFPHPDGPTRIISSPSRMARSRWRTASVPSP